MSEKGSKYTHWLCSKLLKIATYIGGVRGLASAYTSTSLSNQLKAWIILVYSVDEYSPNNKKRVSKTYWTPSFKRLLNSVGLIS